MDRPETASGALSVCRAERGRYLIDRLGLGGTHALPVLAERGRNLVGQGEHELSVPLDLVSGRLALQQRDRGSQVLKAVVAELLGSAIPGVIGLGLGRHDLVEQLTLAVCGTGL